MRKDGKGFSEKKGRLEKESQRDISHVDYDIGPNLVVLQHGKFGLQNFELYLRTVNSWPKVLFVLRTCHRMPPEIKPC